jgi:hypothetical protein
MIRFFLPTPPESHVHHTNFGDEFLAGWVICMVAAKKKVGIFFG